MISRVEAFNFRCLRFVGHDLCRFNVLVGPNAAGKTTFLDVISFLGELITSGPSEAVGSRCDNVYDLFWNHQGTSFELGLEAQVPTQIRDLIPGEDNAVIRYTVKIGIDPASEEIGILGERVVLMSEAQRQPTLFDDVRDPHIYSASKAYGGKNVVHKVGGKNDNFYSEVYPAKGKGWLPSFKFGPKKSALGNLPDDGRRFPASTWFKDFLIGGITAVVLNSLLIRKPSPPGQPLTLKADGSNLPWVVERLREENPGLFSDWIRHVQTALPDIDTVATVLKDEDRHRYLTVVYSDQTTVPSWFVSDGTLRFLAISLLAYLPDKGKTYLIEEPENGLHPPAIGPLFEALSSLQDSQVLVATHSTVALGLSNPDELLCFERDAQGTKIRRGCDHPALREWKGEVSIGTLIGAGILG